MEHILRLSGLVSQSSKTAVTITMPDGEDKSLRTTLPTKRTGNNYSPIKPDMSFFNKNNEGDFGVIFDDGVDDNFELK